MKVEKAALRDFLAARLSETEMRECSGLIARFVKAAVDGHQAHVAERKRAAERRDTAISDAIEHHHRATAHNARAEMFASILTPKMRH